MRIVCISDTHDFFHGLHVPDGDLLIHGGDISRTGAVEEARASHDWLCSLPHKHKVIIAGNHDFCLQREDPRQLLKGLTYLEDEAIEIEGLRIYGSPWTIAHNDWAFQLARGPALKQMWERIPEDTQLLITHGPPEGILDRTLLGEAAGCPDLYERVAKLQTPLHIFGHIHEGYGCKTMEGTTYVNACNSSQGYKFHQPAWSFDWDGRQFHRLPTDLGKPQTTYKLEFWEQLVREHGPPRELRYLPAAEHEHAFWVEVVSDSFGGGKVRFSPLQSGEDVLYRGPDAYHRRWSFTFGAPIELSHLQKNPWQRYSEVPHLPR